MKPALVDHGILALPAARQRQRRVLELRLEADFVRVRRFAIAADDGPVVVVGHSSRMTLLSLARTTRRTINANGKKVILVQYSSQ